MSDKDFDYDYNMLENEYYNSDGYMHGDEGIYDRQGDDSEYSGDEKNWRDPMMGMGSFKQVSDFKCDLQPCENPWIGVPSNSKAVAGE